MTFFGVDQNEQISTFLIDNSEFPIIRRSATVTWILILSSGKSQIGGLEHQ